MPNERDVVARSVSKRPRPRPVLSCLECRRKKLKCDRLLPCQQCLKLSQPSSCSYAPGQEPELRECSQGRESRTKRPHLDESATTNGSDTAINTTDNLYGKISKLEAALAAQSAVYSSPHVDTLDNTNPSSTSRTKSVAPEVPPNIDDESSIFKKFPEAATFSNALRQNSLELDVQSISDSLLALDQASTAPSLAHDIPGNTYASLEHLISYMVRILPAPRICDKLIGLYFENFEHCTRILHKTFFVLEKHEFDNGIMKFAQKQYFVPALIGVLCMASNLNTYPECDISTLKTSPDDTSVISLLDNWYDLMTKRDSATIPMIQVRLLTLQVQKHRNIDAAILWTTSAQLIRQAMIQNLHHEPAQAMSNLEAEIRRNLWLSILEQDLALAISCGMPAQCPTYDLRPPSNCDDNELSVYTHTGPVHHTVDKWTDGLCQHFLGTTFNRRLRAYQHKFMPKDTTHYEQTLKHCEGLEAILRKLPPQFKLDHAANTPSRLMAQMDLDITLRRPLIALYALYAKANPVRNVYREVRVPWMQSNLIVMCFQDLFDVQFPAIDVPRPNGYWDFYHTAYDYDVKQSLEAMLVEGRYLKHVESGQSRLDHHSNESATNTSSVKYLPWDFAAMMKSIEDSLGPMSRRIAPYRGDLRTVVRYSVLYDCLRTPDGEAINKYILDGIRRLTPPIRRRLEREGIAIQSNAESEPESSSNPGWLYRYLNLDEQG